MARLVAFSPRCQTGKQNKGGTSFMVKDLATRPDLSRSLRRRSDPADFKMAAVQVAARQRRAADKRTSSLMPKHTRAYFVPPPSVVPDELLNHR